MQSTMHHDPALVMLSLLIAVFASYTALDLGGRVRASSGWAAQAWLAAAAVAMGGGIWAMHFVAMLAMRMAMPISYDAGLTLLSFGLAVAVTGSGFAVVSRPGTGLTSLLLSGSFMGLGIAGMHYTGMAAIRMPAALHYDARLVAFSVLIAIAAATVALRLTFQLRRTVWRLVAACCMGLAIAGMHYVGMVAVSFGPMPDMMDRPAIGLARNAVALAVGGIAGTILLLALVASALDRRIAGREAAALRASEERFRMLYRHTPLPLHTVDGADRITEVSDAWLSLLQYPRAEVLGRELAGFMTVACARDYRDVSWPGLLRDGELRGEALQFVRKDGTILDGLLFGHVERAADGDVLRVLGGLTDITLRKQAEDAARQAQKMEAVGQLTGGIAHDFNNLLAAIMGAVELAAKRVDDSKATRLLDTAMQATQRAAKLTGQMLAFSRRQKLAMQPVDANATITNIRDMLQRVIGPLVRVGFELDPALWPAFADPVQLEVALVNLAVNARDAMKNGGDLVLRTRNLPVAADMITGLQAGDYVAVAVSDTGEGMSDVVRASAFEPFFTTKEPGKGTGLGLSMVFGFANQAGGTASIDSMPGRGTTVTLYLPRSQPGAADTAAEAETAPALSRLRILLVDDEEMVRQAVWAMLDEAGHHVMEAESGQAALDVLQPGRFDLLLADFAMPGMTGGDLARHARRIDPGLPVVIMSGYTPQADDGALDLPQPCVRLNKPFRADDLALALREVLGDAAGSDRQHAALAPPV